LGIETISGRETELSNESLLNPSDTELKGKSSGNPFSLNYATDNQVCKVFNTAQVFEASFFNFLNTGENLGIFKIMGHAPQTVRECRII
jgi:hypothetical protein